MTTQHALPLDAYGMVQLLRQQVAPLNFLSQLLQNARRAGATGVWINWQPESEILTIRDDGCGIAGFDRLTAVGKPSWPVDIMRNEKPLGIGFLVVALATHHIDILSQNWTATVQCQRYLNHQPIRVTERPETPTYNGTHLTLRLSPTILGEVTRNFASRTPTNSTRAWRRVLDPLVKGFPIPVYFNNEPLPRPHARDGEREFHTTEAGLFALYGWKTCTPTKLSKAPALYCQGLPLHLRHPVPSDDSPPDVLHLPDYTPLLLPNRDRTLDEDDFATRITRSRHALWRLRLILEMASLRPEEFAGRYWDLCLALDLPDLLREAPILPSVISRYEHPLTQDPHDGPTPWSEAPLPTAQDIFIHPIDPRRFHDDDPVTLASLYAAAARLPVLKATVPECHWSHQRAVDLLDPELGMTYTLNGPTRSAHFVGRAVTADVIICDSLTISFAPTVSCKTNPAVSALLEPRTITQWPLYDIVSGRIIVPSNAGAGPAVSQIDDYRDSETGYLLDEHRHADQTDLADLVHHLRNNSPTGYLNSLLSRISPDPQLIGNSMYSIQYDPEQRCLVVTGRTLPQEPPIER